MGRRGSAALKALESVGRPVRGHDERLRSASLRLKHSKSERAWAMPTGMRTPQLSVPPLECGQSSRANREEPTDAVRIDSP